MIAFSVYGERLVNLMLLAEEGVFRRLDFRLADFLLKRQGASCMFSSTHQGLATELGSVREVVSRMLKDIELQGWDKLSRGRGEVVNDNGLHNYIEFLRA